MTDKPEENIYVVGVDANDHGDFENVNCMWSAKDLWSDGTQYTLKSKADAEKQKILDVCVASENRKNKRIAELEGEIQDILKRGKQFAKDRIRYKTALGFYAYNDTFLTPPEFEDMDYSGGAPIGIPYGTKAKQALEKGGNDVQ